MAHRLDELDKRILYRLVDDARNTSAPMIADEVSVSAATIRNRIQQLEEEKIIRGYHARVDYERAGGRLTNVYECNAPVPNRDQLAQRVRTIPGVVMIRELMTGGGNLRITAVGENMRELAHIAQQLADLGLDIEDEDLLQREYVCPYRPFGPEEGQMDPSIADIMPLSGGTEAVTLTVPANAPIAEKTLQEANQDGLLNDDVLIVSIEREETVLTPCGNTRITPNDLVTVVSRGGISGATLETFNAA